MSVRNKFCAVCNRAASKDIPAPENNCSKNWRGTSTSMETDIVLEGFRKSLQMHGLKYTTLVADGDSSVYRKLVQTMPYGLTGTINKIEYTNHLLRNYVTKLQDLATKRVSAPRKKRKIIANPDEDYGDKVDHFDESEKSDLRKKLLKSITVNCDEIE